jgi:hypothetical protein
VLIAYAVMLVFWPHAQANPLLNPYRALLEMRQFAFTSVVLYRGEFVRAAELPADYIFRYLAISLPELIWILLLAGGLIGMLRGFRRTRGGEAPTLLALGSALLLIAVVTPILTAVLGGSTVYDGIRHFIFIIPPLACLAGLSLSWMLEQLSAWNAKAGIAALLLVGLYLIF